ncbi:MAG: sarcosine oxidase subunit gamma family protein [Pseudomonadota bacterium]|nr:sarcosine oxidase subunit gamma family protein [Pseudomonadota bacterium]
MSDPVALQMTAPAPVTALENARHDGPVTVAETGPWGMLTLRGDLSAAPVRSSLADATGLAMPEARGVTVAGDRRVAWFSPDEALILVPRTDLAGVREALDGALADQHALVADMSDARASFRIAGEPAHLAEVLARLVPVDMGAFAVGELRRTRLAQVACALWMPEEGVVELVCFRSVARYVFDLLVEAAESPRAFPA